jgi:hypothetical protein
VAESAKGRRNRIGTVLIRRGVAPVDQLAASQT